MDGKRLGRIQGKMKWKVKKLRCPCRRKAQSRVFKLTWSNI
jgi:hypothetical protein